MLSGAIGLQGVTVQAGVQLVFIGKFADVPLGGNCVQDKMKQVKLVTVHHCTFRR